jgi:hypothetical protein
MAISVSGLWWRSLFAADLIQHYAAAKSDGMYVRKNWEFLSGAGFLEIGRTTDIPKTPQESVRLKAMDEQTVFGWKCELPVESVDGDRWDIFLAGLKRLSLYSTNKKYNFGISTGRWMEIPYELPFMVLLTAPCIAIVRRWRRIHREQRGIPINSGLC